MKLESLTIEGFTQHADFDLPPLAGLSGETYLIRGENRSGKTLTFNALRFLLVNETIDASPGHGSEIETTFTNGARFYRGQPQMVYEADDGEFVSDRAVERLHEDIGPTTLLDCYFLHSHIEQLPLKRLSSTEILELIDLVTEGDQQETIRRHSVAEHHIDQIVDEASDRLRKLEESADNLRQKVSSFETQVEKAEKVISMAETGQLEEIQATLEEHRDLDTELQELLKRKDGIRKQLAKKRNRRDQLNSYDRDINELIAEAVNDFVCPACDSSVPSREAETRLSRGKCPFCDRRTSIGDLKEELREKRQEASGVSDEIQAEIMELEAEREEIQGEIDQIREEMPALGELDYDVRRRLDEHEGDVHSVEEEALEERDQVSEKFDSHTEKLDELEAQTRALGEQVEQMEADRSHAQTRVEELQESSHQTSVLAFVETWSETLNDVAPSFGQEIAVDEDGEVALPINRSYSDDTLSDSERQLMNISFAITLNKFVDAELAAFDTIVMDDPFAHLDGDRSEEVLSYLLDDQDRQYIVTSSDREIWNTVPASQTVELEQATIQSHFGEF